jgi:hypothetical protein
MELPPEDIPRVQAAIAELEGENERAAAVVGAAWLDELLAELIATSFIDHEVSRHLLDPEKHGPLSHYATRVRVAFALGLVSQEQMADLVLIGRIRNLFAHKVHRRSFENSTVSKYCHKLVTGPRVAGQDLRDTPRGLFISTVGFLSFVLSNRLEERKHRGQDAE